MVLIPICGKRAERGSSGMNFESFEIVVGFEQRCGVHILLRSWFGREADLQLSAGLMAGSA